MSQLISPDLKEGKGNPQHIIRQELLVRGVWRHL